MDSAAEAEEAAEAKEKEGREGMEEKEGRDGSEEEAEAEAEAEAEEVEEGIPDLLLPRIRAMADCIVDEVVFILFEPWFSFSE